MKLCVVHSVGGVRVELSSVVEHWTQFACLIDLMCVFGKIQAIFGPKRLIVRVRDLSSVALDCSAPAEQK